MATKPDRQFCITYADLPRLPRGSFWHCDGAPCFAPNDDTSESRLWPVLSNSATGQCIVIDKKGRLYRTK
jgi:hypothetical protein